jgi:hypothetical protein
MAVFLIMCHFLVVYVKASLEGCRSRLILF